MKTKRYWLRGGMSLGLLTVVFSLILILSDSGVNILDIGIIPIYLYVAFPLRLLETFVLGHSLGNLFTPAFILSAPTVLGYVLVIVVYFILGMIGGYVYGKIKNRNKIS